MALLALNKKNELIDALLKHLVIDRIERVLQQFLDGLSCLGVLQAVRHNPDIMESLLIHNNSVPLTAMQVEGIFEVVFSVEGSNNYIRELQTQCHWRDYLLDLEEKPDALEALLQFVTCLREPPVLGFDPPTKLTFTHPDPNDEYDGTPYANTCSNALSVPVLSSYEMFVERMNLALAVGTVHQFLKSLYMSVFKHYSAKPFSTTIFMSTTLEKIAIDDKSSLAVTVCAQHESSIDMSLVEFTIVANSYCIPRTKVGGHYGIGLAPRDGNILLPERG